MKTGQHSDVRIVSHHPAVDGSIEFAFADPSYDRRLERDLTLLHDGPRYFAPAMIPLGEVPGSARRKLTLDRTLIARTPGIMRDYDEVVTTGETRWRLEARGGLS